MRQLDKRAQAGRRWTRTAADIAKGLLVAGSIFMANGRAADAADIRVLTAGAFRAVLEAVVPSFQQRTGDHVVVVTDTAGGVAGRIGRGEAFDLAILTPPTAAPLVAAHRLSNPIPIAAVGISVAVAAGAPKPDITTAAAFRAALLAARSVALVDPAAGGSSGIYMVALFARLGIAAEMTPKLVLVPGGLAADRVVAGQADMAIAQESELRGVEKVVVVGPIPAEVQNDTVYVAALNPVEAAPAGALMTALTGPELHALLPTRGMRAP